MDEQKAMKLFNAIGEENGIRILKLLQKWGY